MQKISDIQKASEQFNTVVSIADWQKRQNLKLGRELIAVQNQLAEVRLNRTRTIANHLIRELKAENQQLRERLFAMERDAMLARNT